MHSRALPLLAAAALGFAAAVCFLASPPRPAAAQIRNNPLLAQPPTGLQVVGPTTPAAPQPLEIRALDAEHFVVATREPRLAVDLNGRENQAMNILCTVVTHYTVRGDRLFPIEHVRVPAGYRLVQVVTE